MTNITSEKNGTFWTRVEAKYKKLFSIAEIESAVILQWSFGAMLFFFFVTFSQWITSSGTTVETAARGLAVCWPYFQDCSWLYFLRSLPYGYTQSAFYMILYGIMLLTVWRMWEKDWYRAHAALGLLWLWKMYVMFVLSYTIAGPYDYYHIMLSAVLLFIPYKEYFLKFTYVFLYFMSVTTKFDATWTLGTYFTAMRSGLPFLPEITTTVWTNLVIFMQIIGCWFLLSKNLVWQRLSLTYFVTFHLYSGILVFYTYPSITLPILLILFGPMYRHTPMPFSKKTVAGWIFIVLIALFQLLGFLISPDRRITLEGNRFGMFMFEANHQCIATVTTHASRSLSNAVDFETPAGTSCSGFFCLTQRKTIPNGQGVIQTERYESGTAWNRCDPYIWYTQLAQKCARNATISHIALQFDHSINGGPFFRIVDAPDICALTYKPFSHNEWILLPPDAPLIGYPVENSYHY